ncbi:hypothetical protein [Pseudoalteromonas undina]|uniref:hypothetical protein n=1 Tax=Pseudoalteromonas TaxID=53246 RepID=UPI001868A187|nr:hypothetical protein [Pseudoalteromonas undina]
MKSIIKSLTALLLLSVTSLQAHEIWLVKENNNQVKLFLGEPGEPDTGDKLSGLKNTKIYTTTKDNSLPIVQNEAYWSTKVTESGDVRATVDDLWKPWDLEDVPAWMFWKSPKKQAAKLFAKAGRNDTQSETNFEFVPVSAQSDTLTLTYLNTPVKEHAVMVLTPNKEKIKLTTDKQGNITVPTAESGLYVVSSDYPVAGETVIAGHNVDSTYNITSITFWVE